MRSLLIFIFLLTTSVNSVAQSKLYVNDTLRVGLRAQPASSAKKVSIIKTGDALKVLDSSNSKYYKVKTASGKIGWVSRSYVDTKKPAFMRIDSVNSELKAIKAQLQSAKGQFEQVQEQNISLEGLISRIKEEKAQLQSELDTHNQQKSILIPSEYQLIAWIVGTLLLILLGFIIGVQRTRNQVRNKLGGLDI